MKNSFKNQIRIPTPLTPMTESHTSYVTLSLPSEYWAKKPNLSVSKSKILSTYASRPETARNSLILSASGSSLQSPKCQSSRNPEKTLNDYSNHESVLKVHESVLKKSMSCKSKLEEKQVLTSSFKSKPEDFNKKSFKSSTLASITKLVSSPLVSLSKANSAGSFKQKPNQVREVEGSEKKELESQGKIFIDFREIVKNEKKVSRVVSEKKIYKKSKKRRKIGIWNNDSLKVKRFSRFSLN